MDEDGEPPLSFQEDNHGADEEAGMAPRELEVMDDDEGPPPPPSLALAPSTPPTSTAIASQAEEGTTMEDNEEVQDPNPSARLEMPEEEDQGPPPPAQFVTLREEMDEEGGMAPRKVAKAVPDAMDENEGLPPSNLELDEEAGMTPRKAAKGAPTMKEEDAGPTLPPSFQEGNAAKKPNQPYLAQRGENALAANESGDLPGTGPRASEGRGHTQGAATAPPSRHASPPVGRIERVPGGSILRRLAGIPIRPPPHSMLPSRNASDPDSSVDPTRPGNVDEPDSSIPILEATLVEDQVLPALVQNDGPVYEATQVREWKLRHKVLAGASLLAVAAGLVFIGVRPPPSDSNSTALKSNSTDYTLRYYADGSGRLCMKDDSERPDEDSGANFYQTIADCCKNEFWHLRDDECLMNSFGMTHVPSSTPSGGPTFGPSSIPSMRPTMQLQSSALRLITSEDIVGGRYRSTTNMAVQGDTAVLGAPLNDNTKGTAFVMERNESGWSQLAKLEAPDREEGDGYWFGWSVAIDDDTIAVSAPWDDSKKGSVHIFLKINDTWQHQARLVAPDRDDGKDDYGFGFSVDIHQDRVVVGAHRENIDVGVAHVFVRNETVWALESNLLPWGDWFGYSVGIFDDTIVVGAPREDAGAWRSGAAHIYARTSGGWWEHRARLSSPDGASLDDFGHSVGIHGNRVIIGAPSDDGNGEDAGASFVFADDGSAWTLEAKLLAADGAAFDYFGLSASIFKGMAVVGSPWDDDGATRTSTSLTDNGEYPGSVYLFDHAQGAWSHRAKVLAPDGATADWFGWSVDVHNGTIIAHSEGSGETFAFSG